MIGSNALIGYTGFVGAALARQHDFDAFYNSKNIETINGEHFNLVVCAGAYGLKWRANENPLDDFKHIAKLINHLTTIYAGKIVLISTIDVYDDPCDVNEDTEVSLSRAKSYSMNRAYLEFIIRSIFGNITIIRLPSIYDSMGYGQGVIYDIKNKDYIYVPRSGKIQVYDIVNLWKDIKIGVGARLRVLNIAPEPISVESICGKGESGNNPNYDMKTNYAFLWGKEGDYQYSKEETLSGIRKFIKG